MTLADLACATSDRLERPAAIVGLWVLVGLWLWAGLSVTVLGLLMGSAGITVTQLILAKQSRADDQRERDMAAIKAMNQEMVRALPEADDRVAEG